MDFQGWMLGLYGLVVTLMDIGCTFWLFKITKEIEPRVKAAVVNTLQDKDVVEKMTVISKNVVEGVINQDYLEAQAGIVLLSMTDPEKPYMKQLGQNLFECTKQGIYGMMGAESKKVNALAGDLVNQAAGASPLAGLMSSMSGFVKPDSMIGKALADPAQTLTALAAFQKALPTLIDLGKAAGVINK